MYYRNMIVVWATINYYLVRNYKMQVYHCSLFIAFLLPNFVKLMSPRKKRILYGHEANDRNRDAYQVFRYYVFLAKTPMGTVDENPESSNTWDKVKRWFRSSGGAKIEWLDCGGALITPNVVQTACHCLALYTMPSRHNNFTYGKPLNVWEDRIYSYVGSNEVKKMPKNMLIPKHYVIYQQCRAILFHLQFNVMDYGLIITENSIVKRVPKAAISYAPVYRAEDILNFYYKTIQIERMCLVIGHGDWSVPHLVDFEPFIEDANSELQRWGWRTIMNYMDCYSSSYPPSARKDPSIIFDYKKDSTWVCLQAFKFWKRWNYRFGSGDSGGPVSCDSVYFALASMVDDDISMAAPIAHTSFENAAEFRDDFLRWIDSYNRDPDVPVEHVTEEVLIPTPLIYRFSRGSPPIIGIHLLIICTLFSTMFFSHNTIYFC